MPVIIIETLAFALHVTEVPVRLIPGCHGQPSCRPLPLPGPTDVQPGPFPAPKARPYPAIPSYHCCRAVWWLHDPCQGNALRQAHCPAWCVRNSQIVLPGCPHPARTLPVSGGCVLKPGCGERCHSCARRCPAAQPARSHGSEPTAALEATARHFEALPHGWADAFRCDYSKASNSGSQTRPGAVPTAAAKLVIWLNFPADPCHWETLGWPMSLHLPAASRASS